MARPPKDHCVRTICTVLTIFVRIVIVWLKGLGVDEVEHVNVDLENFERKQTHKPFKQVQIKNETNVGLHAYITIVCRVICVPYVTPLATQKALHSFSNQS